MKIKRSSGVLLHITSLPGKHGIGTMGLEAYHFVDLMKEGGQRYWQMLPFGPVSPLFGYSPYSSFSSFAGNYLFINLEMLQKEEWMRTYIMSDLPENMNNDFVDFESISLFKLPLLRKASENFFKYADPQACREFEAFCESSQYWLEDYAMYMALASYYDSNNWLSWSKEIRLREPAAMAHWKEQLAEQYSFHRFVQFMFYKQWTSLKEYANKKGIKIIGDIPIYVNFDSADAWSHPSIYQLDPDSISPTHVSGVPPDYFSPTGQRWGNPLYQWWEGEQLKEETLDWWAERCKHMFTFFDITRLDHFRGLQSYWSIPASELTAINGTWEKGPGIQFFKNLQKRLGPMPIIAEDLGVIDAPVEKLRDQLKLPGMKILQFAFDANNKNPYLPHNFTTTNSIVYTGTHDNDTTNGWFYETLDEGAQRYVMDYLSLNHQDEFHWQLISLALRSIADLAIFPAQDILGFASKFRMNTPASTENNWRWKLTPGRLNSLTMQKLKTMCVMYNRV